MRTNDHSMPVSCVSKLCQTDGLGCGQACAEVPVVEQVGKTSSLSESELSLFFVVVTQARV